MRWMPKGQMASYDTSDAGKSSYSMECSPHASVLVHDGNTLVLGVRESIGCSSRTNWSVFPAAPLAMNSSAGVS